MNERFDQLISKEV